MKAVSISRIARDNHFKGKSLRYLALSLARKKEIRIYADVGTCNVFSNDFSRGEINASLDLILLNPLQAAEILLYGYSGVQVIRGGLIKKPGLFEYDLCDPAGNAKWIVNGSYPIASKCGLYVPEVFIEKLVNRARNEKSIVKYLKKEGL